MNKLALPLRFGIIIGTILISFFLILSLFKLHTKPFFSLFNVIITGFGIFETMRYYKMERGNHYTAAQGFIAGMIAGLIGTLVFTGFFFFYSTKANTQFLTNLLLFFKDDYNVSLGFVVFIVALLGFATTLVFTLGWMRYFKQSRKRSSYKRNFHEGPAPMRKVK